MSWSETEPRVPKVLIIGYGNDLRCDDGAGVEVVRRLEALARPDCETMSCRQLLPEHAALFARADLVVLIDACVDAPAGEVRWSEITAPETIEVIDAHAGSPAAILALARYLFHRAPIVLLATIGGESWDIGTQLTPPVRRAVKRVCRELPARIDASLHAGGCHA